MGRSFLDDADLERQNLEWLDAANSRPSSATGGVGDATGEPPSLRLKAEVAKGGVLPPTAVDYGFAESAQVNGESFVHARGNVYSVPIAQVRTPVTVRVHRERIVIWRDTVSLAEHKRARDGAHQRVVLTEHFAPLYAKKPRARVMLQRQALLELGGSANSFVAEVSRRQRDRLATGITALYELYQRFGQTTFLAATAKAQLVGVYRADYLELLLATPTANEARVLALPDVPPQSEVDRLLSSYEEWVSGAASSRGAERLVEVAR